MSQSKTYPVKSNAARAALKFGIGRDALVAVEGGGWAFEVPEGVTAAAPKRTVSDAAANLRAAKAAAKAAKAPKKTKAKKVAKAKTAKAKPAKAAGSKRKAGARTGIVAEVIAELKARYTSADDILKKTGWVSNTFRGILGAHKKKTGENFERKKIDGVTHYRIAA